MTKATPKKTVTRYALLLRGINVGTGNSLPMADLRAMLEALGSSEVRTYVQSGNAVFTTKLTEHALTKAIEAQLHEYMGRPIATTLRTREQLAAVVAKDPLAKVVTSPSYSCVTFLSHEPTKAELSPLEAVDWGDERVIVRGREIYTWHPNGQARSPLAVALGKLKLRGAVTTRNWNTVCKLLGMLSEGTP